MAVILPNKHHNARNHFSSRITNPHDRSDCHDFDDLLISCIFPSKKPKALLRINTNFAKEKSLVRATISSPVLSSSSSSGASLSPSTSAASAENSGIFRSVPSNNNNNNNNNYTLKKPPPSPKPSLILANDTTSSGVINVALPRRLSLPNVPPQTISLSSSSAARSRLQSPSRPAPPSLSSLPNHPPQYKHGSPRMSLIRNTLTQNIHNSKRVRPAADKALRRQLHQHVVSADHGSDSSPAQPTSTSCVQPSVTRSSSYSSCSSSSSLTSSVPDSLQNLPAKACQAVHMPSNSRRGATAISISTTPRTNPLPSSGLALELSPDPTDPNNITRSKQAVSLANLFINYTVASTVSSSDLRRNLSTGPTVRTFQNPIENADDLIRSGSKLENAILDTFERVEISPSPQTMVRAQKARANMEIHYDLLASYQGLTTRPEGLDNEGHSIFAGLPNFYTYNPLQVIRNRKARAPFVALEPQTLNASSSASHHHWTVDISEFIVDQPWRYQNYHLIRDAKGKLRYPSTTTVAERDSTLSRNIIVSRLNKLKQNLTNNNGSRSRNNSMSDTTTPDSDVSRQPSVDERHRTGIFNVPIESIQKSKPSELHSDSTSSINSNNFTTTNNHNTSNTNIPFSDKKSNSQLKNTLAQNNLRAVPEDDRRQNSIESDVAPSAGLNPECDSSAEIEPEPIPVVDLELETVRDAATELACLELIYLMRYLSTGNKVTVMSEKTGFIPAATREVEVKQISTEFHQQVRVQRDVFPRVKKAVEQREEQVQTLRRAQLSKTSTRIDKLLVDTDQTINRLATTLNLEVKQLSERMDLLERSAHKVRYKWLILNASYLLLEYLLVFVMWVVWGLVSIMLGVRRVSSILGRFIKWLLWC